MNTPISWLKVYVPDLDVDVQEFVDAMTLSGSHVEGYEKKDKNLEKIVVGKIEKIEKHPDADKLIICQVNIGAETIQIVTGAPNVKEGDLVPVVLDGGKVAGGHDGEPLPEDGIKIKKGKLRGIESNGMMCSIEELGSSRDLYPEAPEYGIYIFGEESGVKPGDDAIAALGLHDSVVEYEITSNRVDCFSMIGMAREAAATFDKEFHEPEIKVQGSGGDVNDYITVDVQAPDLCPRYTARVVTDLKIGPSPKWMRERLASQGIRSINNLVDITNYVMEEYGQPMHAYDLDTIAGKKIVVKRANDGDTFVTLDGQERKMDKDVLMICDGEKEIGIAGIMGGENSMVTDDIKTLLFEAACFDGTNIRLTTKRIGLATDAAAKFVKGLDPNLAEQAINRACQLIEELGCGKVSSTHVEVTTGNSLEPKEMKVSIAKVNGVLGIEVPTEDIVRILTNLGFAPVVSGDELTLMIPAYREDMEDYPDVAEEVIRMYGYDHVIPAFMPTAQVTLGGLNLRQQTERKIKEVLCAAGAYEGIHYSFFSPADLDLLRFPEDAPERHAIRLINPINVDLSLMRTTLASEMLYAIARNQKKGILEGRIFELGNIFIAKELPLTEYPDERETLCAGVFGEDESFFTIKGLAETVADALDVKFTYKPAQKPFLHPYQAAEVFCDGQKIGYLGQVRYEICDELDMRVPAYVMELDLRVLSQWYGKDRVFTPISKFDDEKRDFAFVVDKDITCEQIENGIREACDYVSDVTLFDVYEGVQLPPNKKSMAYSVVFTPKDEELKTKKVEGFVKDILAHLKETAGITLRG